MALVNAISVDGEGGASSRGELAALAICGALAFLFDDFALLSISAWSLFPDGRRRFQ
jgi:hypothetical protein